MTDCVLTERDDEFDGEIPLDELEARWQKRMEARREADLERGESRIEEFRREARSALRPPAPPAGLVRAAAVPRVVRRRR